MQRVKDNYLIIAILLGFFLIKLLFLQRFHSVIWDEAVYLGMGKYIYSFGSSGLWEIVRPIGLPLVTGFLWMLGLDYVISAEFISLLFSLGNIYLTYLIAKNIFGKKVALISALLVAVTPVFFLYSSYILTGISSTFFTLLAVYFFIKKYYKASFIFAGIASYFRLPQGLILVALLAVYFINSLIKKEQLVSVLKKLTQFVIYFLLTLVPYLIFNFFIYKESTTSLNDALFRPWILGFWAQGNPAEAYTLGTKLATFFGNLLYYIQNPSFGDATFMGNIFLLFAFLALIIFIKNKEWKDQKFTALIIVFLLYIIYYTFITNKQPRFLVTFLPFYGMLSAYAFNYISEILSVKFKFNYLKHILLVILLLGSYFIISDNFKFYSWRYTEEPAVVGSYYRFFNGMDVSGPIITTDPLPAVYTDFLYLPAYRSSYEARKVYDKNKDTAYGIIFSFDSFFCAETDTECSNTLNTLYNDISSENKLIFNETYMFDVIERTYYIYQT